ncbi:hypothetical protein WH297_25500 [Ochrobactrum vermis]|uniref:Uncharacterized protein n=1 Tax=Ochrobactrum vermis TaxID=1827297 RepID=A0ABU8PLF4_9HYPH|nr:hypothetical protein [Ochrobactrum vermis]
MEHFVAHTRDSLDGPADLGVLRDHPFIAGLIFVTQIGSESHSSDYFSYAVRLHGIWNSVWDRKPHKVIITAVARKFINLANAPCKKRQKWVLPKA